jgi:hypothetical protein
MATFNELFEHCAQLRAQILADISTCRSDGWRLIRNDEDVTEIWLRDQQDRADKLGNIIAGQHKPPVYLYGAF